MKITQHPKYKIWTTKPNFIVTFSTDGNIWVKDKHTFRIKARCPEIAVERATELLKCFNDPDAVFISTKKYFKKKTKQIPKKIRLRELKNKMIHQDLYRFFCIKIPTYVYNFRRLRFDDLIGVQPMKNSDGSLVTRFLYNGKELI